MRLDILLNSIIHLRARTPQKTWKNWQGSWKQFPLLVKNILDEVPYYSKLILKLHTTSLRIWRGVRRPFWCTKVYKAPMVDDKHRAFVVPTNHLRLLVPTWARRFVILNRRRKAILLGDLLFLIAGIFDGSIHTHEFAYTFNVRASINNIFYQCKSPS